MTDVTDKNPLIANGQPANTLNQCAAALEWMSSVSEDQESVPTDDEIFGRYLLEKCIVQALRYEAGRITGNLTGIGSNLSHIPAWIWVSLAQLPAGSIPGSRGRLAHDSRITWAPW